jgi:hypothetical protein
MELSALDGSNPLAFLAALGTLRLLHLQFGEREAVRMRWCRGATWTPELSGFKGDADALCQTLLDAPRVPVEAFSELGEDITVSQEKFRDFVRTVREALPGERRTAEFAAAFGNEVCLKEKADRIVNTEFCFITGSGHQHFLGTMRAQVEKVTPQHFKSALFGPWQREKGLSMRWDPKDAAEYALRWSDPSTEGASAVWGVNRLAVEALPIFPTQPISAPARRRLRTTGFQGPRKRGDWPQFTWPIWTDWASLDVIRSLVSLKELQEGDGEFTRKGLEERGIGEVFRAQRVRIGQGANFKVSFRPARAI